VRKNNQRTGIFDIENIDPNKNEMNRYNNYDWR